MEGTTYISVLCVSFLSNSEVPRLLSTIRQHLLQNKQEINQHLHNTNHK